MILLAFSAMPAFAQVSEDDILKEITKRGDETSQAPQATKGDLEAPFKIEVDGSINLNYVFAESPDTFLVNYKVHLDGMVRNKVDIVKGKGQITADIKGFLAKWPTGECQLKINVGEFPFEMIYNQVDESKVRVDIKMEDTILENWESNCKFVDAPGSKFNTKGNPERWVSGALKRTAPSFRDLQLPVDRLHRDTTTLNFTIDRYLVPDPPLGSVEIEGKGTVKIIPET
ncbi:MAG: hypothetical protein A2W61_05820 [Deltaproteobacteria bacterium RIFCSPLOWO2_01_44_7]|nr:MAG: hypothetical protein A2712_04255 [Deltaproteobacteria bacterium RIFCSPHIGHO2_01_FULL_43_49]OGQ16397.1 MAG: hypothetical protein A3D22_02225 [Deltaproteobacteria bacterium RIFCSPHIGHO2_02_FULL_44_53]OGQ27777.1 MAG: hypothetical protein A3D98_08765 [Deltaproteobacteria bacterium RIFCSPHIGHO2_12_FULL_44_21]OGQ32915.1 MAG: hypothetical protein A2979_10155 [Deltaproteobacteria bacterium RIFCSPLOWO2_01_FULL_45_74]OGQ41644.1 MAG: hypothetical protein A2W61_05820 [Deltaproteobacteria bacterium 